MDYQNKAHMDKLMTEYARLPDTKNTDNNLYDELIATLKDFDDLDNTEILNSLKLITIQLCESIITSDEDKSYYEVQEKYK
tara:strand:+ start:355 stop:597 length:243 start_codon:yes stop_codon:yes gene_type:complete